MPIFRCTFETPSTRVVELALEAPDHEQAECLAERAHATESYLQPNSPIRLTCAYVTQTGHAYCADTEALDELPDQVAPPVDADMARVALERLVSAYQAAWSTNGEVDRAAVGDAVSLAQEALRVPRTTRASVAAAA